MAGYHVVLATLLLLFFFVQTKVYIIKILQEKYFNMEIVSNVVLYTAQLKVINMTQIMYLFQLKMSGSEKLAYFCIISQNSE